MDYFLYELLSKEETSNIVSKIQQMEWQAGTTSNKDMLGKVKSNLELNTLEAAEYLNLIYERIKNSAEIKRDTYAKLIFPPMFSQYKDGGMYGPHADAPFMKAKFNDVIETVRTDYACTVFLTDEYEGGELVVEGMRIKGKPGSCVVYPADSLHQVTPVTKGERICAITWIESSIRDKGNRSILREVGYAMLKSEPFSEAHIIMGGVYSRLMKKWT